MEAQKQGGWFRRRVNAYLDERTEKFILTSIDKYAKQDEVLAERIRWEVTRRGELGKRLDIHEPLRWTAIQTGLSFVMGGAIKAFTDKKFSVPALWTLGVSTVLMNSIQLVRLVPRYQQGLEGAVETALKLEEKSFPYDPFTRRVEDLQHGKPQEGSPLPARWADRAQPNYETAKAR